MGGGGAAGRSEIGKNQGLGSRSDIGKERWEEQEEATKERGRREELVKRGFKEVCGIGKREQE